MKDIKTPMHMAIILDGNGRWAKEKGMSRSKGHEAGFENLKKIVPYIFKKGISILSVFAFSTENFKRSEKEVSFLMNLFVDKFKKEKDFYMKENIKVVFSGRMSSPLPKNVQETLHELEETTSSNTGGILNVCINYGGHAEIVDAVKKIINSDFPIDDLDEKNFSKFLYQDLPPIDYLIRTSGESRVSNFMLWQLAYAEFYFKKIYFPDFNEKEVDFALEEYAKRDRRFGGIQDETKSN